MTDPLDDIRATFFEECEDLLQQLEQGLSSLRDQTADDETVDAIFRAVHSIKGGAAAFALDGLRAYAHAFEDVLDALRRKQLDASHAVVDVLLRASDTLADLVAATAADRGAPAGLGARREELAGLLVHDGDAEGQPPFVPVPLEIDIAPSAPSSPPRAWRIAFEPLPGLLSAGIEPLYLLQALAVLGRVEVDCDILGAPSPADLDHRELHLRWTIRLAPSCTDLTETEIEAVFDFAEDLCILAISPEVVAPSKADAPVDPSQPDAALDPKPRRSAKDAIASPRSNDRSPRSTSIRIDLDRVDELVDLVGEMVIAQAMLGQAIGASDRRSEAAHQADQLDVLTRELQDRVMSMRALPVRPLFQRMGRIVREAATATGKSVRLSTDGEETRIDKAVIELLADPLTHMVRNAIDHGLETPDMRRAADKAEEGVLTLSAVHRSDRVVIEVSDDGAGIARDRVLAKARAAGLVEEDDEPVGAEIDRLIFHPGLSTSDTVDDLSGRGVGMDVVATAIHDLSGNISVSSEPGEGTKLSISLPLTLAILDGMIVRAGRQRYVVPLASISETQLLDPTRVAPTVGGLDLVRFHDRYVPLWALADLLQAPPPEESSPDDRAILFLDAGEDRILAFCVDQIEAQRQVVVKALHSSLGEVPGASAATILGDGQVALILDARALAELGAVDAVHRRDAS